MKVVFTAAIMDLCHQGHLNLLKKMRERAGEGRVIVILHDDKSCYQIKGKIPIQNIKQRRDNLWITELVDDCYITLKTDPADQFERVLRTYPDAELLFMRGDDNRDFPGKHLIDKHKIPTEFINYTEGVSSTLIRNNLINL
jgi:cytidyltransferase-like protein